jgi:hypothetical protein
MLKKKALQGIFRRRKGRAYPSHGGNGRLVRLIEKLFRHDFTFPHLEYANLFGFHTWFVPKRDFSF